MSTEGLQVPMNEYTLVSLQPSGRTPDHVSAQDVSMCELSSCFEYPGESIVREKCNKDWRTGPDSFPDAVLPARTMVEPAK